MWYIVISILVFITVLFYLNNLLLRKRIRNAKRELKLRNEKIALAIHAGRLAIWGYDIKKDWLYNIEGDTFPEEGSNIQDAILTLHDDDREIFKDLFIRAMNGDVSDKTVRVRWRKAPELPWEYIEKEFAVIRSTDGSVETVIGTHRDVTEDVLEQYKEEELLRKHNCELIELNRQLEIETERAQQADKLKTAFLANISHEIRTPLNSIVGFSELLDTVEDSEERAEYIRIIKTNNKLLLQLIGDILDLSKIESGTMELRRKTFDISLFFDELVTSLRQQSTRPEIEFIIENPYKSYISHLDPNRIIQVVSNFVINALKYTAKGYIKVGYIHINDGIKVYVEDSGIGIPADKHQRIFQRFEKLNDFSQGAGVGLSISKAIADSAGGEIGFTSEEGKGSTFWAWVPCKGEFVEK